MSTSAYREIYKKILEHPTGINNLFYKYLEPAGMVCEFAEKNSMLISTNGEIYKCSLLFGDREYLTGEFADGGVNIRDSSRKYDFICEYDACGNLKNCSMAPICLGDHCPAARLRDDVEGFRCPDVKGYIDLLLRCIHRFHPFPELMA